MAVLVASLLVTGGCSGTGQDGSPPEPPGPVEPPPGLGDPYFPGYGNGGYQVEHYDLRVTYDPASKELVGRVTATAVATENLSAFTFDLSGLTAGEATIDGVEVHATQQDEKLMIVPAAELAAGSKFTVTVAYDGIPEPVTHPQLGTNGFHHTDDGAFAIGQPRSASTWFPVNDHPLDKASYTFEITVPDGLAAVTNGVPLGSGSAQPGWTTWRWSEPMPMASYLATLAIGDYRVHETEHDDRPVVVAVHSDLPASVDEQLARTGEIADVLAEWFGPYPFSSYGGIVLADQRVGFALETQSRPIYGPGFFAGGQDGTWVIVHELAHQWFGNSVSLSRWDDMWLNEGFATYAEWLWAEEEGEDTAAEEFDNYWEGPGAEQAFWDVPPGDPGAARLFHNAVYVRGAMTLHALRENVGDQAFFEILETWADTHRHGNATTTEFVTLCEQISGQSLDGLFKEWLHGTSRPDHPSSG